MKLFENTNMKKIIIISLVILFIIFGIIIMYKVIEKSIINRESIKFDDENIVLDYPDTVNQDDKNGEVEDIMENINVIINNKKYSAVIENNDTAKEFLNSLPQEFNMEELNGNEKYVYMDTSYPTNSINPKHIECGDIMLYGNDCLVIFYKSFDTSYSYTKIGHINNLLDLGNSSVTVKFEK